MYSACHYDYFFALLFLLGVAKVSNCKHRNIYTCKCRGQVGDLNNFQRVFTASCVGNETFPFCVSELLQHLFLSFLNVLHEVGDHTVSVW